MTADIEKRKLGKQLQATVNAMQGLGKPCNTSAKVDLAPFDSAFPEGVFPKAGLHEFISHEAPGAASTSGFMAALAAKFMKEGSLCIWVGKPRLFPSALMRFGLQPDRVLFMDIPKTKEALWAVEEALKCEAITAVIGEIQTLGFTESRRFQLAVERSGVLGLIHRIDSRSENATACTSRWKITPLPSIVQDGLPGVGQCSWDVQLLKVKNGKPASWQIHFAAGRFIEVKTELLPNQQRNVG